MDVAGTLEDLVRIDSVNASLGGPGEGEVGHAVAEILTDLGAVVEQGTVEGEPAANVIGRFAGPRDAPVILLEAHLDTVPQPPRPVPVERSDGHLSGRGSCDTKASAVAMLAAIERLTDAGNLDATVVFAGVVDEEATMHGAAALPGQVGRIDAAVVGEPTSLVPVRAHNGFARIRIVAHGVAAHTSKAYLGRNALTSAARIAITLEERLLPQLEQRGHPLIGPALITPTVLRSGHAPNVVPDTAELVVDRRIAPGEDPDDVLGEIDHLLDSLREEGHRITRDEPFVLLPGVETPDDHPLVQSAVAAARAVLGPDVTAQGAPYGTDACRLAPVGGVPCVVLGPGSIDQAHTVDEWVDLAEVERCAGIYVDTVRGLAARLPHTREAS